MRANRDFAPGFDKKSARGGARTARHEKILVPQGAMDRTAEFRDVEVGTEQRARYALGFQKVLREVRCDGIDGRQQEIEL